MSDKEQTNVRLPTDLMHQFRVAAMEENGGKFLGSMERELGRAVRLYLSIRDEGTRDDEIGAYCRKKFKGADVIHVGP